MASDVPDLPDEQKGEHLVGLLSHAITDVQNAIDCAQAWDLKWLVSDAQIEHLRLMCAELRGEQGTLIEDFERLLPESPDH